MTLLGATGVTPFSWFSFFLLSPQPVPIHQGPWEEGLWVCPGFPATVTDRGSFCDSPREGLEVERSSATPRDPGAPPCLWPRLSNVHRKMECTPCNENRALLNFFL